MTIKDYLRILRARWAIVAFAVAVCLVAALATYAVRPTEYTARMSMYVSATGAEDAASAAYGAQLSLQRVKSYVILLGSRRIAEQVVARLDLPDSPDDLSKRITASTPVDSQVIDLEVVDRSPDRAAIIANTVYDEFVQVSAELTRNSQLGQSTVALRMVEPAPPPRSPSSTGLGLTLALGLLAGLIIGVAAAFVRNTLDTSIRTRESLAAASGARVLGTVTYDVRRRRAPTTDDEAQPDEAQPSGLPRSSSEDLRKLRTNLRFGSQRQAPKVVVVASALTGEGKTTLVVDLAATLAAGGLRVLLVDGDLRRPMIAERLGLATSPGVAEVLSGKVRVGDAIQRPWEDTVHFLSAGAAMANPSDVLTAEPLETVFAELRGKYDAVLVDSPALDPYTDAAVLAAAGDGAVLVCRSGVGTHAALASAAEGLRAVSAPILGAVLVVIRDTRFRLPSGRGLGAVPWTQLYRPQHNAADPEAEAAERSETAETNGSRNSLPVQRG
ncbi:polysaccharide biosynthesis tyrosine autokinase [Pseudonocardia sp. NPDC049154]|uniref:polysaccharide biosynthesis tyrosine autokinase n=1 Tax=Pseudonocardia sp. NPDC049154 TaxID=3155501 RepID=UPI0033C5EB9B